MAAGSLSEAFIFDLKRKRYYDDDDMINDNDLYTIKRRNLTQLPIRSPPTPTIAVTPAFGQYATGPGTLTPDSIPEDDVFSIHDDRTFQSQTHTRRPQGKTKVLSYSQLRDNVATTASSNDMDMNPTWPKTKSPPTPIRIGRCRSNDLMSPVHAPSSPLSLSPSNASRTYARDRIPTPVASSFPARSPFESSFASAAARQLRPHGLQQSTSLSPMVDAESWTPQMQRPPSPGPEFDQPFGDDAMMADIDDSHSHNMNSSFTNLSVHSQDNLNEQPGMDSSPTRLWSNYSSRARGLGLDGAGPRPEEMRMSTISDTERMAEQSRGQSSGRTAKLHMGFRADCDKCVARVPGHYSHIIWS